MRPSTRSSRTSRATSRASTIEVYTDPVEHDDDDDETTSSSTTKEKGKKPRHRMTNRQLEHLEALFLKATHPSRQEKEALAKKVAMDMRTVTVWFQNRRQLAKKMDDNALRDGASIHPALNAYRNPLLAVKQPDQNVTREGSPVEEPTSAIQKAMSTLHAAARKQIKSDPDVLDSRRNSLIQIQLGEPEEEERRARRTSGTKRMLEWACKRGGKRARLEQDSRGDNPEDESDTTEDEDTAAFDRDTHEAADSADSVNFRTRAPKAFPIPARIQRSLST
ncbi:LIM/homeobox protein Lhx4 [Steccherinum ochraceum]|uniref:LIM/homeobox protein Lhx4 n=1 Tax=Steccherinum ochraceum TaxID=92696 RepID=A0A4R0R7L9_9APHY|nr:LIM/homeobox protein Lhx4 [Steccherinum ochraceum]